jgi:hypothetical protein
VFELRPSDGALLGIFNGGSGPTGIAFDGANLWVADGLGTSVYKI